MIKIAFIADFFANQVPGGGELNNEVVISKLLKKHQVVKFNCHQLNNLKECEADKFIVSNFVNLKESVKNELINNKNYVIYEHDHKYLRSRNPASYKNFLAPKSEIINEEFYKTAKFVYAQSLFHKEIICKNLDLKNVINLSGNMWDASNKEFFISLSKVNKTNRSAIMVTNNEHKNTLGSINYCKTNNLQYELIPPLTNKKFLDKLSKNKQLVFLPKTPETLSRISVEARMLNMGLVTNGNLGAASETWFSLKGEELIEYVYEEMPKKIMAHVERFVSE